MSFLGFFSFLINGQPSHWCTSSRGVCQGDPISSLLFLLVTQNLSIILNHALHTDFLCRFDSNLSHNINHFMFTDDLILISKASRMSAINIMFCIKLYANISDQNPNHNKSAIYLPSWFNSKVSKSISSILDFKLVKFPFTYLGAPISPFCLPVNHFNSLVMKTKSAMNNWSHSPISQAGQVTLLNSSLFFLPTYLISISFLPDFILDSIDKLACNFLWGRNGKGGGFNSIGWHVFTLNKSEGGSRFAKP